MLKDYFASDIPEFEYPNFAWFLESVTSRFAGREALRHRVGGRREFDIMTYRRLGEEARAVGRYLLGSGFEPGDRIALWAENRPEWCVLYLAVVRAGLVVVPVDALLGSDEAAAVVAASSARALWTSGKYCEKARNVAAAVPTVDLLASFDDRPEEPAAARTGIRTAAYRDVLAEGSPLGGFGAVALPEPDRIAPETNAAVIFTSGTTGKPKGVVLSHRAILANVNASFQSLPVYFHDVFMCVLPLHHTYPTTCSFLSPLTAGSSVTICEKVVGKVIVDDVRDSGGTIMIAVPLLYDKLKQAVEQGIRARPLPVRALVSVLRAVSRGSRRIGLPGIGKRLFAGVRENTGLASLRLLVSGGGALSAATADFFDDIGFLAVQGYGMSENAPLVATNTARFKNNESVGLPVRHTEVRIAGAGADGIGEVQYRSPSLMTGYWNDPEATREAFTEDGWLRSGDLGSIDEDGFIFLTGRSKNLIVTAGGKNVSPEEIEARFDDSPIVREVLVLGRRNGSRNCGERIVAVCVPDYEAIAADRGGKLPGPEEVERLVREAVAQVNRMLPSYQKIDEVEIRKEEFEKTSSRKIRRFLYTETSGT